ncbi:MAG: hypothetical protein AB7F43_08615 [Bacteriovoracia bacterium]
MKLRSVLALISLTVICNFYTNLALAAYPCAQLLTDIDLESRIELLDNHLKPINVGILDWHKVISDWGQEEEDYIRKSEGLPDELARNAVFLTYINAVVRTKWYVERELRRLYAEKVVRTIRDLADFTLELERINQLATNLGITKRVDRNTVRTTIQESMNKLDRSFYDLKTVIFLVEMEILNFAESELWQTQSVYDNIQELRKKARTKVANPELLERGLDYRGRDQNPSCCGSGCGYCPKNRGVQKQIWRRSLQTKAKEKVLAPSRLVLKMVRKEIEKGLPGFFDEEAQYLGK